MFFIGFYYEMAKSGNVRFSPAVTEHDSSSWKQTGWKSKIEKISETTNRDAGDKLNFKPERFSYKNTWEQNTQRLFFLKTPKKPPFSLVSCADRRWASKHTLVWGTGMGVRHRMAVVGMTSPQPAWRRAGHVLAALWWWSISSMAVHNMAQLNW